MKDFIVYWKVGGEEGEKDTNGIGLDNRAHHAGAHVARGRHLCRRSA